MTRKRVLIVTTVLAVTVLVVLVGQTLWFGFWHADCRFAVQVKARIVADIGGVPVATAYVLAFSSRADAEDTEEVARLRKDARKWIEMNANWREIGFEPPSLAHAPSSGAGGNTGLDGRFAAMTSVVWSYNTAGVVRLGARRPPERSAVEAIRIEIEGREPIILDAPLGTWTEHPNDDNIWATYDMGVIRVPAAPTPAR